MIDSIDKPSIEDATDSSIMMNFIGLQRATGYLIANCKFIIITIKI